MLLQFSVTNHRSIKDTAIISLKASTDKSLSDCLISPDEKKQLVPVLAPVSYTHLTLPTILRV